MRVFIFLLALLVPLGAAAAERPDSAETRLRLVETELERLRTETKDHAKDEADKVREKFADKIDNLEKALERAKGTTDQWLTVLSIMIGVSTLIFALAGVWGAWKASLIAKAEARDALRGMLEEVDTAKAELTKTKGEIEALLKEVRQGHGEVMSKVAEIMAADIAPEDYTPDQQATVAAAAQQAAAKPESERSEIDHWAMAKQAILAGDSGKAADHLADADESHPKTWVLRARVKQSQGDRAGAQQDGETALRLSREQQSRKDEANALDILEKVYSSRSDWPQAKAVSMEVLQIRRELVAAEPDNSLQRLNLAVSLGNLAQRCLKMKDVAEARGYATEAVEISRTLHEDNPDSDNRLDQLALSFAFLGQVCMEETKWTEAKAALTESMRIRQGLQGRDPANTEWLRSLALCWNRLGMLARGQQDWSQARACAVEYRVLTERLASLDPRNAQWQMSVAYARRDNANCDWQLGHLEIAQAGYLAAIQRLEALEVQGKLSAEAQKLLEECRQKLAEVEKQMAAKGEV